MNLKELFDRISTDECFGYAPASSSTKPAHIANGWFRRLMGKTYDPVLLNNTLMHWVGSEEANPSEKLLEDNKEVFEPFLPQHKSAQFTEFRADLRALLSPYGGAVNRGNVRSSYNVTHREHLTKDFSDNSVGAFLYHVLNADCGQGPSPMASLLVKILEDQSDEISTLTLPLTRDARESPVAVGSYPAKTVFRQGKDGFVSPTLKRLRLGFDQLQKYETQHGGGLQALRRAVSFGVFAVMLHIVNRSCELRREKDLTPILLYFQGRRRTTVYHASHQTYTICRQSIEFIYTAKFMEKIAERIGEEPTVKQCQRLIRDLVFTKPQEAEQRRLEAEHLFAAYRDTQPLIDALASALTDVTFRLLKGDPTEFYRALGVRIGFLRPTGGARKYFTLDGVLLESVLASLVSEDQMSFREFLDLLYERYGLLTGGRAEDAEILLAAGIDQVTVEDLRENAGSLRQQLVAMGWARAYADGVMTVHLPVGGLL